MTVIPFLPDDGSGSLKYEICPSVITREGTSLYLLFTLMTSKKMKANPIGLFFRII